VSKYVCRNYGSCSKADAREEVELVPGTEPICEECGSELKQLDADAGEGGSKKKVLALGAAAAVLLAAGLGFWFMKAGSGADRVASAASRPAATPTATGVAPNAEQLAKAKQGVDASLQSAASSAPQADQRLVIAREYIKAAIPLMQAGKWAEAQAQLDKAKSESADEPLIYINQAILQLKQAKPQEAMAQLEVALQKGFRDFAVLESDADLKALTSSGAYKALATRYQAK
jgi:hypothetical protein